MDSAQLVKSFSSWYPFCEQCLDSIPDQTGVYVLRKSDSPFGRLKGKSDILYVGSAKGGLRQRLYQYFHPELSQGTNRRIYEYTKKYKIEFAWRFCDEAKSLEHDLLKRYLAEHDELPPLNNSDIRQLDKIVKDEITLTDKVDVIKK